MVASTEFNILDLESQNEEIWFDHFHAIQGGPIAKCLVLVAILKRQLLISPVEGLSFKEFIMRNEKKAQLALDQFGKKRSLYAFRCEMRGLLGLPRSRKTDSPKGRGVKKHS